MIRRQGKDAPSPAQRALAYRDAFLASVTPEDVTTIGAAVLERAKAGDLAAAKLVLDRVLGSTPVAEWPATAAIERDEMLNEMLNRL